jgi:hypothetical protein
MSIDISEEEALELIENRVKFKLYAAEQHLKNLKILEQDGSNMQSFKERVRWEMEIESFLFHIVGVRDSLLVNINNKLELRLEGRDIDFRNIRIMLNYLNEQNLLTHIKKFDDSFVELKKFRNQSTHHNLINIRFSHSLHENVNTGTGTSDKPKVSLIGDKNKYFELIPFLEISLQKAKEWVQVII